MDNRILYFGNFKFPHGNAAGSRVLGNAYSLRDLGNKVTFVDFDENVKANASIPKVYDNFNCYSFASPRIVDRIFFFKYLNEIKRIIEKEKINILIMYGNPVVSIIQLILIGYCKRNNIKLIIDIADWHSANSGSYLIRIVKYLDISFRMKYLNTRSDGVITVSSYLKNYYNLKGLNSIVIPPLINKNKFVNLKFELNPKLLTLIYVGQPFPNNNGRSVSKSAYKDRLDIVIESLFNLKNRRFIFNIYGITKKEYLQVINDHHEILKDLEDNVIFHGKVENSLILNFISNSDFSILFRENSRLSNAGFPTKFVESVSCGTPMITTFTSDLEKYISVNKLGFGVSPDSISDFRDLLERILTISKNDILEMKNHCFNSHVFSYENFTKDFEKFLKLI
ncbi:glycosyltransferase [Algoriphagus ratkowskyi]|nr:glycosyltransferase [Algoriphagus ratkowskyi]